MKTFKLRKLITKTKEAIDMKIPKDFKDKPESSFLSKTTADKEKLFITKEEEIFLESISDKEIPEKILMMDVFFGTKSTVFEKYIYVNMNKYMEEEWIIQIKRAGDPENTTYQMKHQNTRGELGKYHNDRKFNRLDYCYLYISNHNKKFLKKKNPLKKKTRCEKMNQLFKSIREQRVQPNPNKSA
jgi:hypothetical protein